MMSYGSITAAEAFTEIGCLRLAARIADLKAEGYNIRSDRVTYKTKSGKIKVFASYSLEDKEADA
jgi:hypothetical protein